MVKLPLLPAREIVKALQKVGFDVVSQKGSHMKLKKKTDTEMRIVIVPNHPEVLVGTLASILRQAGLTREEFLELL
jgi:predicted RNA binding protein YcfA (HicA-like mRNA interferase family)